MADAARASGVFCAGLLIFIPLGLVDVIDDHIQEPLNEVDHDVTSGDIWIVFVAAIGHSIVALFGDVLYTGIVARAVVSVRLGDHRSLWEIVRTLPYLRLAIADVLLAVIVGIGIVALIIPA